MKIIHEESVYLIPEDNNIVVLAGAKQKDIIDCFTNQFVKKKRNYCKVLDSENQSIKPTELNFIYYPYGSDINSNFVFGTKSIFNIETTNLIQENENDFKSFELIREGFRSLITDHGMYKLRDILTRNIGCNINLEISDFDISKFLSMLDINIEDIPVDQQYIMIYNLLLFVSRNQFNVVYIDFPITQTTLKWLKSFDQDNILFLLNNDYMACDSIEELEKFAMLIVSNKDYIEKYEFDLNQFNNISYIQNPYTMLHKQQQTEKNIRLMEQFEDKNTTFYLTFNDTYTQDIL